MASLYKKQSGVYYLSLCYDGNRLTKSLGTRSYDVAKRIRLKVESNLLNEILYGPVERKRKLTFRELAREYLEHDEHAWAESTRTRNGQLLRGYLEKGLPSNPTTRAMMIRVVNGCNRWGFKRGLITHLNIIPGGYEWESRHRVFNDEELNKLFENVRNEDFNQFVRFAYYTGARSGEIRILKRQQLHCDYILVNGKTGVRVIKINSQARRIIDSREQLWSYRKYFIPNKFKKECRRLEINDARFHDLRRTFGYNLIKQGKPIYEVSKLLGHSSVTTTERHYAPLLTTEIEDFEL